jgi:hypothetical protein
LRLAKTAFLVSIISPSYVKSRWCLKELHEFYQRAADNGGIMINNKSRIFKVVKMPFKKDDLLKVEDLSPTLCTLLLEESLGYEFYEVDKMSGRPTEFRPELGHEYLFKFVKKLEDLAWDIRVFIERHQSHSGKLAGGTYVYLAETTPELNERRDDIKRELQLRGYRVLPDRNFSMEGAAYEKEVAEFLKQSVLSVHLIGADHTSIPAEEEYSMRSRLDYLHKLMAGRVQLQHELAMERAGDGDQFSRIVWMPEGLEPQEPSYSDFVKFLCNDPGVYDNAEVLCGSSPEDLKTIIQKKLAVHKVVPVSPQERKRIYLICEKQDAEAVAELEKHLTARNYEVTIPFKQGADMITGHKENQRQCDAILIFYGNASDYSIQMKLKEVQKNEKLRQKPLLAKGIYIIGPETGQKSGFAAPSDVAVMKNFADITPDSLDPFLKRIESSDAPARTAKGGAV